MSDTDLCAEVAELRKLVAGTRAEAARAADEMVRIATALTSMGTMTALITALRAEGIPEGRAEHDAYEATLRAQRARAGFQVLPGGRRAGSGRVARRGGAS